MPPATSSFNGEQAALLGYSGLLLTGGAIGYLKARSIPSLVAGSVFSGLIYYSSRRVARNPYDVWPIFRKQEQPDKKYGLNRIYRKHFNDVKQNGSIPSTNN